MILETLAADISKINSALRENASKAINKCVTYNRLKSFNKKRQLNCYTIHKFTNKQVNFIGVH